MSELTKEARLLQTFARLADTLVDDYDVVDLLQTLVDTCHDLLDTTRRGHPARRRDRRARTSSRPPARRAVSSSSSSSAPKPVPASRATGPGEIVSVPDIAASPRAMGTRSATSALELGIRVGARRSAAPARDHDRHVEPAARPRPASSTNRTRSRRGPSRMSRRSASCMSARSARPTCSPSSCRGPSAAASIIEQAKGVVAYTNGVTIERGVRPDPPVLPIAPGRHQPGRGTTRRSVPAPRRLTSAFTLAPSVADRESRE